MSLLNNQGIKQIHCIGIGGIGVSGIAEILLEKGYRVSGSDLITNSLIERLSQRGAKISKGHRQANLVGADAVVFSSAISDRNPELIAAKELGLPMIQRGKLLAELMDSYEGITVCGTHGKTTTTGIIAHILLENNMDPTFVMGGILNNMNSPAHLGQGKYFVAEADESDASFLYLKPKIAVVTNIDADHLDAYEGSFSQLKQSFVNFLQQLPETAVALLGVDDPVIRELLPEISCKKITYGFSDDADIRAHHYIQNGLKSNFTVTRFNDDATLRFTLHLPGKHNVLNALGAIAVAYKIKVSDGDLKEALLNFPGVGRRFYSHGEINVNGGKALLFDDYGHHPRAIQATLEAARQAWPSRRIVLVFQPHRYSRTRDLMEDFANVLSTPDELILLDVYSAGETEIAEADGRALCRAIIGCSKITPTFVPHIDGLLPTLKSVLKADDIVIFQGAGSVGPMAVRISEELG